MSDLDARLLLHVVTLASEMMKGSEEQGVRTIRQSRSTARCSPTRR